MSERRVSNLCRYPCGACSWGGQQIIRSSKRSRHRHCLPSWLLGKWQHGQCRLSDYAQPDTRLNNEKHCKDNLELARTEDNHSDAAGEVTTEPGIYCCLVNLQVLVRLQTSKHRLRARLWTKPVLVSRVQQQAWIEPVRQIRMSVIPVTNKQVGSYRVFDTTIRVPTCPSLYK